MLAVDVFIVLLLYCVSLIRLLLFIYACICPYGCEQHPTSTVLFLKCFTNEDSLELESFFTEFGTYKLHSPHRIQPRDLFIVR